MLLSGKFYQNAYVTRDIAAAVKQFEEKADVRLKLEVEGHVERMIDRDEIYTRLQTTADQPS